MSDGVRFWSGDEGRGEERGWGEATGTRGVMGGEKASGRSADDKPSFEETLDSLLEREQEEIIGRFFIYM